MGKEEIVKFTAGELGDYIGYGHKLYKNNDFTPGNTFKPPENLWIHDDMQAFWGVSSKTIPSWLKSSTGHNIRSLFLTTSRTGNEVLSHSQNIVSSDDVKSTKKLVLEIPLSDILALKNLEYLYLPQIDIGYSPIYPVQIKVPLYPKNPNNTWDPFETNKDKYSSPDIQLEHFLDDLIDKITARPKPIYIYLGKHQQKFEEMLQRRAPKDFVDKFYELKENASILPNEMLEVLTSDPFLPNDFAYSHLGNSQEELNKIYRKLGRQVDEPSSRLPNPLEQLEPKLNSDALYADFRKRMETDLDAIAKQYGLQGAEDIAAGNKTLTAMLKGECSLKGLDALIAQGDKPLPQKPLTGKAAAERHFINNSLRPHLDSFIATALIIEGIKEPIDWQQYPALAAAGGAMVDSNKIPDIHKLHAQAQAAPTAAVFTDILDHSKGDHFTRLTNAINAVDGSMGEFTQIYRSLSATIAQSIENIELADGKKVPIKEKMAKGAQSNAFLEGRAQEMRLLASAKLASAEKRNDMIGELSAMQHIAYVASKAFKGIPLLEGLTEAISESTGGHHIVQNMNAAEANLAVARVESEAQLSVAEMLEGRIIDVKSLEREMRAIDTQISTLRSSVQMKEIAKDENKQRAIADAFINKSILSFGWRMSNELRDVCTDNKAGTIDDFLNHYLTTQPRLGEALQNLAFGFADSNDLSVILAESAAIKTPKNANDSALHDFVETVMKPNIASLYSHGSKVDIVYQSNLSGLGSNYNAARVMIRSAHDETLGALFSDAFGVESEMSRLTVRGALDVKNVFDFYLHRHGDKTITDTKVRDGVFTGEHVKKRVSVLPEDSIKTHTEIVKSARGFRQSAPDISDMFLRICGYEYFYPQAANAAQRTNIMVNNPEAPAAYIMANAVITDFIERMSFSSIEKYREKVGDRLDNLIAQTFMDFFAEMGNIHSADPVFGAKKADLKQAVSEANSYGFAFDSYAKRITKDASSRFDLFLKIYERNLEKQLETAPQKDAAMLEEQIAAVKDLTKGMLNPSVIKAGSQQALSRAHLNHHAYENTLLGARVESSR